MDFDIIRKMKESFIKLFYRGVLLFVVLLSGGCIDEDRDGCADMNNLVLMFHLEDQSQQESFSEKIHVADVFIFNGNGQFVSRQTVNESSLSVFTGTALYLEPGEYRIVCWGNASDKTSFSGLEPGSLFENAFLANATLNGTSVATGGDPLYYAPYNTGTSIPLTFTVTVPVTGTTTQSIGFGSSHILVQVYVKGFTDKGTNGENLPPVIELTDIPPYYNFEMQTFGPAISYRDASSYQTIEEQQVATVDFYTPVFKDENSIQVLIKKSSDGSIVTSISLEDFMKANNITVEGISQAVVSILVEYKQTSVEITIPGWGQTPVSPEL